MALARSLLAPFFLLLALTGCDKPSAPPAPKLDSGSHKTMPETKMPAAGSAQPTMQPSTPTQR